MNTQNSKPKNNPLECCAAGCVTQGAHMGMHACMHACLRPAASSQAVIELPRLQTFDFPLCNRFANSRLPHTAAILICTSVFAVLRFVLSFVASNSACMAKAARSPTCPCAGLRLWSSASSVETTSPPSHSALLHVQPLRICHSYRLLGGDSHHACASFKHKPAYSLTRSADLQTALGAGCWVLSAQQTITPLQTIAWPFTLLVTPQAIAAPSWQPFNLADVMLNAKNAKQEQILQHRLLLTPGDVAAQTMSAQLSRGTLLQAAAVCDPS